GHGCCPPKNAGSASYGAKRRKRAERLWRRHGNCFEPLPVRSAGPGENLVGGGHGLLLATSWRLARKGRLPARPPGWQWAGEWPQALPGIGRDHHNDCVTALVVGPD